MTTAAEKVAGISDVLEQILIRLPAKSLARSKLVSKQWLSQISNPQFLQHHFGHRPNKLPTGMFPTDYKSICSDANFVSFNDMKPTHQTIPSLGFLYDGIKQLVGDRFSEIKLLNSCNGLLLCLVTFKSKPSSRPNYCVCNPTTKKFRLLSETPFCVSSTMNTCLAFDPSLSLQYKVIYTKYSYKSDDPHEICIYSSENQCWSTYASPFDPRGEWFFLNDSMYCAQISLRFDVYTEKMEHITMPPRVGYDMWYDLPVIGSHVYRAVRKDLFTTDDLRLVEMSSDFSEWVPKYHISVTPLLSAFPEIKKTTQIFKQVNKRNSRRRKRVLHDYLFDAICVVDGVKEDESDLVLRIPGKLILYNLKKKTAKELCKLHGDLLTGPADYRKARIYQFIECLFDV